MAKAYSDDLRGKVLSAYGSGKGTMKELAERFGVSYGWVRKIAASERLTGSALRVPQRRASSRVDTAMVRQLVRAQPDAVLRELQDRLRRAGHPIGITQLWRVLKRLDLRLKKSRSTPPSATPKRTAKGAKPSSKPSARRRPKT